MWTNLTAKTASSFLKAKETADLGDGLLIKGAEIYPGLADKLHGDILVKDGRVAQIGTDIPADGADIIDARGLCAAPGLVDMHVHLRDPGQTYKEDIISGCEAAAAGGVTSLLAMANTVPTVDTPKTIKYVLDKAGSAKARVYTAAAVTLGQRGEAMTDFDALARAGAAAFSDDGHPVPTAKIMAEAMKMAAALGKPVISHCEDPSLAGGKVNLGKISQALGIDGESAAAEETQVAREATLALSLGYPVHIAHVSTANSVAIIRDAKLRGAKLTCESCPHYFSLDEDELLAKDADFRMNPPLRTKADVAAIIRGLADGTIDAIVTDHAPHSEKEKADFLAAPNGVVGLETSLAAGITYLVRPGALSLGDLIDKMSANPARILGIEAGTLCKGVPADIVVFDPHEKWLVEPGLLHSRSRNTPYKGRHLYGKVRFTVCAGRVVYGGI
jgi:dihydroorotase